MRKIKMVKCPSCGRTFKKMNSWCTHMTNKHPADIPEGFSATRYFYGVVTGKFEGSCMYCGDHTEWNEMTGKYGKLCGKHACRDRYAKEHQLLSPDKQREMLSKRQISSIYNYKGIELMYTGSYELNFLTYLDTVLHWPESDIMSPSPNTYYYDYKNPEDEYHEGKKFYIPDFYIPSLNLEIEIKDQTTTHPKFLKIDKIKEAQKDKRMAQLKYKVNYIKINNNDFSGFFNYLESNKLVFTDDEMPKLRHATESFITNCPVRIDNKYDMTIGYDLLLKKYGKEIADQLLEDPSKTHLLKKGLESFTEGSDLFGYEEELSDWCNSTNVIVIHSVGSEKELDILYRKWICQDAHTRVVSDGKSERFYGMDNAEHYQYLKEAFKKSISLAGIGTEGAVKTYFQNKLDSLLKLNGDLSSYAYGVNVKNPLVQNSESETIASRFRGINPKDFDKSKIGICWDYTQYQETILRPQFTEVSNYYMEFRDHPDCPIHSFTIVNDAMFGLPCYLESAYKIHAGLYFGTSSNAIIHNIAKWMIKDNKLPADERFWVYEYSIPNSEYENMKCDDFVKYVRSTGKEVTLLNDVYKPIVKVETLEDLMSFTHSIAQESFTDGVVDYLLPATEAATEFMIKPDHSWYVKLFTGGGVLSLLDMANNLHQINVTVKDGNIIFSNIMAYTLFNRLKKNYNSKNIKNIFMRNYNPKSLIKYKKKKINRSQLKIDSIYAPEFFALELVEIFNELGDKYNDMTYLTAAQQIYNKTWLSSSDRNCSSVKPLPLDKLNNLSLELLPYQKEFIERYPKLKAALNLNGYVLSFVQGLGKTLTAMALAECMEFDRVYIVCPNSLKANWALELRKYYKKYQESEEVWKAEVCICGDKEFTGTNPKYIITNQESISKMYPYIKEGKNLLVVDESQNFRNINGKRVNELLELQQKLNTKDNLMLSATPIKATPNEIAPVLRILDPLFTETAADLYVKAFNIDNTSASEMVNKRFGKIIYRKDKSELPDLPEKNINELYYSVADENEFLLSTISSKFFSVFSTIYKAMLEENEDLMKALTANVLKYSKASKEDTELYCKWIKTVNTERKLRLHDSEKDILTDFLKDYVYPNVPSQDKYDEIRSLEVKFVHMKNSALSTAVGQVFPPARKKLFIEIFDQNFDDIVERIVSAEKKTVIFSQFKPVVNYIYDRLNEYGIETVMITGDIVSDRTQAVLKFQEDDTVRVLVATSATMGTGFTLIQANQMFFFGTPWRDADFDQCCDRIHRIGQTSDVEINIVLLESGTERNVSTRMNDVLAWSREMFNSSITVTEYDEEDVLEEVEKELDEIEAMESVITDYGYEPAMEGLLFSKTVTRNIGNLGLYRGFNTLYVESADIEYVKSLSILSKFVDIEYLNMDELLTGTPTTEFGKAIAKSVKDYAALTKSYVGGLSINNVPKELWLFEGDLIKALWKHCDLHPGTLHVVYGVCLLDVFNREICSEPLVIEDFSLIKAYLVGKENASTKLFYNTPKDRYEDMKMMIKNTKDLGARPNRFLVRDLKNTEYYHVSTDNELESLVPRIPHNFMKGENYGTKRICVSTTIEGCFRAIPDNRVKVNEVFYVYKPLVAKDTRIMKPTVSLLPDQPVTDEHWILDDVKIEIDSIIIITDIKSRDKKNNASKWEYVKISDKKGINEFLEDTSRVEHIDRYLKKYTDILEMSKAVESYLPLINPNYQIDFALEGLRNMVSACPIDIVTPAFESVTEIGSYDDTHTNPVFIVLMHSGSTLSKIVKAVTKDEYTHACISLNSKLDPMYSFGNRDANLLNSGLTVTNIHDDIWSRDELRYEIFATFVTDEELLTIKKRLSFFEKNADDFKFHLFGLPLCGLQLPTTNHRKYFCSRFVADIINSARPLEKDPSLYKPNDLKDIPYFISVGTGEKLYEYDSKVVDSYMKTIKKSWSKMRQEELNR